MPERDTRAIVEKGSPPYSHHVPQNQESGWMMALKAIFWLLFLPSAVLLLFKWLMTA